MKRQKVRRLTIAVAMLQLLLLWRVLLPGLHAFAHDIGQPCTAQSASGVEPVCSLALPAHASLKETFNASIFALGSLADMLSSETAILTACSSGINKLKVAVHPNEGICNIPWEIVPPPPQRFL